MMNINGVQQNVLNLEHDPSRHRGRRGAIGAIGGAGIGLAAAGPVGALVGLGVGAIAGKGMNKAAENRRRKRKYRKGERAFDQYKYVDAYNYFNKAVIFPVRIPGRKLRERAASKAIECIEIIGRACEENGAFIQAINVYRGAVGRGFEQLSYKLSRDLYINAARWMLYADNHLPPLERNAALLELEPIDRKEVSGYHKIFDQIIVGLENTVEDRLSATIKPERHHDIPTTRATFKTLHEKDLIKPLLEMGRLGTLGLHRLSKLKGFPDATNYITPSSWENRTVLQIEVDPSYSNLERLAAGRNGTALGLYYPGSVKILTAMVRQNPEDARGTAVHELTHYVIHEVFQNNNCDPYLSSEDKERFNRIAIRIKEVHDQAGPLPELIRTVFTCYTPDQYHCELIVRIPQLLAIGVTEADLQRDVPDLLNYYKDIVLPRITTHAERTRTSALRFALGDWPEEVITHPNHALN